MDEHTAFPVNDSRSDKLPPVLSVYLNLVRFGAAIVVVLHHAWPVLFPRLPLPWPGHDSVVVFFVLSGLVIAHATNRPGLTWDEYALHRVARVWSVLVPALALSLAISAAVGGAGLTAVMPAAGSMTDAATNALLSLLALGQIWFLDRNPPLNAPFWSLNFEVWYYVLFGIWLFASRRARPFWLAAVILLIGPKILLLLPVWLIGVLVYWRRPRLPEAAALALFLLTAAAALIFIHLDLSVAIRGRMILWWPGFMSYLGGSNQFVGDTLLALIVGAHFTAAASLGRFGAGLLRAAPVIDALAGATFSAYLYHAPLLAGLVLGLGAGPLAALGGMVLGVALLSRVTEHQVGWFRSLLRQAVAACAAGPARLAVRGDHSP